jgi:hypothetical protein
MKRRRPKGASAPAGSEGIALLRNGVCRTFSSPRGHIAASFLAFLNRYRHLLI